VVDTFYVTDLVGHQISAKSRQTRIRRALLTAIGGEEQPAEAKAS
jgi:[protein-PII] uridylyltransferase